MNNESWYAAKLSDMDVVRICESDDWMVDYDKSRGMYRVSYFQDNHFKDEFWFDAYEHNEHSEMKMFISKWFSALEDEGVNPWAQDDCIRVANKLHYTEKDYKRYLNTIA